VLGPKIDKDEDVEEPYIFYVKNPLLDEVEEYHRDDIKMMLRVSGTAYYEDADVI
jgi:hypothetical protein